LIEFNMQRKLTGKPLNFRPASPLFNPYRVLLWVGLILAAVWMLLRVQRGEVQSPFLPTPTPTRMPNSYILEAQTYFEAGKLDDPASDLDAIGAYQKALEIDPNDAQAWAELARIQTYSSSLQSSDQERLARLQEALASIKKGVDLAPDDSTVYAIYALVLDWNASSNLISAKERETYLIQAEGAANRAYLLDPENALALAFYAEVLLDQQKLDQAIQYAEQAVLKAPELMDTHRVYATVLETYGNYRDAILEYQKASEINPNLTFLVLRIGLVYRHLQQYQQALDYFAKAVSVNEQLGVRDPLPYIAIAKTYAQQGEFFIASRNAEKALLFDPTSANGYGQLGMIYVQARNYESALPALRCAVEGCAAADNRTLQELAEKYAAEDATAKRLYDEGIDFDIQPLELTNLDIAYYYVRYGSVLAYLNGKDNVYCQRSLELMSQLRAAYPDDPLLITNVEDNEATCYSLMGTPSP
jgi:tetratricopeptide (TPR) repeat protein